LCFIAQVICICEEYNSVCSRPTEADKIGPFGQYRYIGKIQILARYIGDADVSVYLYQQRWQTVLLLGYEVIQAKFHEDLLCFVVID